MSIDLHMRCDLTETQFYQAFQYQMFASFQYNFSLLMTKQVMVLMFLPFMKAYLFDNVTLFYRSVGACFKIAEHPLLKAMSKD